MKSQLSTVIAVVLLFTAAVVGVVAWVSRDSADAPSGDAASATAAANADPSAGPTTVPGSNGIVIPKKTVNPLGAKNYCRTAKLLAIYTRQGYGLDRQLGLVDGKKFDRRLKTIGAAFGRLADQAPDQPRAGDVAPHWQRLAEATNRAERTLRVSGLRAHSDAMIVELAKWRELSLAELPRATATLKAACGFSGAVFGV